LVELRRTVRDNLSTIQEPISVLLFTIHDWLAYITYDDQILPEYTSSLGQEIDRNGLPQDALTSYWIKTIRVKPISLKLLVYRHLLVGRLLEREIFTQGEDSLIYQLMASLQYQDPRFTTLEDDGVWDKISKDTIRINALRSKRVRLRQIHSDLTNRPDESDHRLEVDHAKLSSFALLYCLLIIEALLDYELAVRPNARVAAIRSAIIHTLDRLRGVFFHVHKT
jgi:hypothetical protein